MGYSKNIAVIKGLKDGFSADGGALTGLIKAEKYGNSLNIEVTFINFAPLTQGRYVTALSDGKTTLIVENGKFEGTSELDTSRGFAALVCYINGQVSPVASAVSGNFHGETLGIRQEVEKAEFARETEEVTPKKGRKKDKTPEAVVYEDEAIAEENYYEYAKTDEGGGSVCENPQKEKKGFEAGADEAALGAFEKGQGGVEFANPLARGDFYSRMKGEIEGLLRDYPKVEELERTVENSRWVKVTYGGGKFYVFGVLYGGSKAEYLCYGVPSENGGVPPESMKGLASFIPTAENSGYWVMYQDADTGATLKIEAE